MATGPSPAIPSLMHEFAAVFRREFNLAVTGRRSDYAIGQALPDIALSENRSRTPNRNPGDPPNKDDVHRYVYYCYVATRRIVRNVSTTPTACHFWRQRAAIDAQWPIAIQQKRF